MKTLFLLILLGIGTYALHHQGVLDGTRFSLHPAMELDLSGLSGKTNEPELLEQYPKLDWDCYDEKTDMGDRVCTAPIRSWNGLLAKHTAFFFNKRGSLNMAKFAFRESEHGKVTSALTDNYGESRTLPGQKDQYGKPLVAWVLNNGLAVASENVEGDGEATMMWMSGRVLMQRLFKGMLGG